MFPILHFGPLRFYSFGLTVGCAICLGYSSFWLYFHQRKLPVNTPALGWWVIGCGLFGAKLDSFVTSFITNPNALSLRGSLFQFFNGGYTYLGGLVAGLLAAAIYVRIHRLPWLKTFDSLFCIGVAYALGRVGCFLAGDGDYGIPSTVPWAVSFPHGIVPTLARVHPTMLYCTAWELAVFAILWKVSTAQRKAPLQSGILLGVYLIGTSLGRFLIEFLSRNRTLAFGLTEAQLVSIALFVVGTTIISFVWMKEVAGVLPLHWTARSKY